MSLPPKVIITEWKPGLQKISLTMLIRSQGFLGLADSKACTDRLLDGDVVEIDVKDVMAAETLVSELKAIGAIARILDS